MIENKNKITAILNLFDRLQYVVIIPFATGSFGFDLSAMSNLKAISVRTRVQR